MIDSNGRGDKGILPKNIPSSLRSCPQWVVWRSEDRDGNPTKLPYQISGKPAKSNSPSTWADFDTAWSVYLRGGYAGVGFMFSKDDDFCGIDLDGCRDPETGEFATWAQNIIEQFDTYCEVSPSGSGVKLFLRGKSPLSSGKNLKLSDVEPLGGKSPGVEVYDRKRYFALTGWEVETVSPNVECRQPELNDFCERYWPRAKRPAASPRSALTGGQSSVVGRARKYVAQMPAAIAGQGGHDVAFRTACVLIQGFELSPDDAYPIYADWNQTCEPPWSDREMRHKLESAEQQPGDRGYLKNVPAKTGGAVIKLDNQNSNSVLEPESQTDVANARRFVAMHGENVRYCYAWKNWLVFNGQRWQIDNSGEIVRLAKMVGDSLWDQARATGNSGALKAAAKCASARGIKALLELAQSDVPIMTDELDQNPWALNCPNGTIDLKSGTLQSHRRGDFITQLCPIEFDSNATAPTWAKFLGKTFDSRESLIKYMQRVIGHALTGIVNEQILLILHGIGSNGKSTFLNAILEMLGPDYAMQAVPDLLMATRSDKHPTERADLFGKRFVCCAETEDGRRLSESLVKQLTGGEKIRARRMNENFWEFDPTFKLVICTNHEPAIKGTDHAIWRRIRKIPFSVVIPDDEQDKTLPEKLRAELPGILSWAVDGCLNWQRDGLQTPPEVLAATNEYRASQDVLAAFIEEKCVIGKQCETQGGPFYKAYREWSEQNGEQPMSGTKFGNSLTERGFPKEKRTYVFRKGIKLSSDTQTVQTHLGY